MVEDQNFVLSEMNSIETTNVEAIQEVVTYQNGDKPIILIIEDNYEHYYSQNNHIYNIEDQTLLDELSSNSENEEDYSYNLKLLNIIMTYDVIMRKMYG